MKVVCIGVLLALAASSIAASEVVVKGTGINFDYLESDSSGKLDSENTGFKASGIEVGVHGGGYTQRGLKIINDVDFSYDKFNTKYVGALLYDPASHYGDITATTKNKLLDIKYQLGVSFRVVDNFYIGGQAGAGHRQWERSLQDTNTETYEWSYWIYGVRSDWKINETSDVSIVYNWQKAAAPYMHSTYSGDTYDLGGAKGSNLNIRWNYGVTQRLAFQFDYVYDCWDIKQSNVINGLYEPDSNTKNQYLKAGIAYRF